MTTDDLKSDAGRCVTAGRDSSSTGTPSASEKPTSHTWYGPNPLVSEWYDRDFYRELLDLTPRHMVQQVQVDLVFGVFREADGLRST